MKHNYKILALSTAALIAVSGILTASVINSKNQFAEVGMTAQDDYSLTLDSSNAPTSSEYSGHTVVKPSGASFTIKYTGAKASSSGHIVLEKDGELIVEGDLKGLHSVLANFGGGLKAVYGVNDKYDYEKEITTGSDIELEENYLFNHIKLVATEEADITNIKFNYTCDAPGIQKVGGVTVNSDGAVVKGITSNRIIGEYCYFRVEPIGENTITSVSVNSELVTPEADGTYKMKNGTNDTIDVVTSVSAINSITCKKYTLDPTTGTTASAGTVSLPFTNYGSYVRVEAPEMEGYSPNQDYVNLIRDSKHTSVTIVYSKVDKYVDGVTAIAPSGSGTTADPFLVSSCANWEYIKAEVDANLDAGNVFKSKVFKLTKTLDFDGYDRGFNVSTTANKMAFAGNFDGNFCAIRNWNGDEGLFGNIAAGLTIARLSVYGTVTGTNNQTGAFASYVGNGSSIKNCKNYATVSSTTGYVGGFVGYGNVKYETCDNYANVTATHKTSGANHNGGFSGYHTGTTGYLKSCNNFGTVTGKSACGGLVGNNATASGAITIENSNNFGSVNASYSTVNLYTGGILGYNGGAGATATITGCANYGTVTASNKNINDTIASKIGGILGGGIVSGSTVNITDTKNFGDVNGQSYTGGIFGYYVSVSTAITVTNSINLGDISSIDNGTTVFGGIGSFITGTGTSETACVMSGCINCGDISAASLIGGMLASGNNTTAVTNFTNCVNYGNLTSTSVDEKVIAYTGGMIGWARSITSNTLSNCVNYGEIYTKKCGGYSGLVGYTGGATTIEISDCSNHGYVHGGHNVGGFVGATTGADDTSLKVLNCVNDGIIDGTDNVGGLIGCVYAEQIVLDITGSTSTGTLICPTKYKSSTIGRSYIVEE